MSEFGWSRYVARVPPAAHEPIRNLKSEIHFVKDFATTLALPLAVSPDVCAGPPGALAQGSGCRGRAARHSGGRGPFFPRRAGGPDLPAGRRAGRHRPGARHLSVLD